MNGLFDLVGEFQELYEMATDEEVDTEVFLGTLESLTGELEAKGAGYVSVINQLLMEQEKAEEIAKRYSEIAKQRENAIDRMKSTLCNALVMLDKKELNVGDFKINVKANGGLQPLEIKDPSKVPENLTKIEVKPDNKKIREYLADGKDCEWAELKPRGKHIECPAWRKKKD